MKKIIITALFFLLIGHLYCQEMSVVLKEGSNPVDLVEATIKSSGNIDFLYKGITQKIDFSDKNNFYFTFNDGNSQKIDFESVGYDHGAAYLYGKTFNTLSNQMYRVAIKIEKATTDLVAGAAFKIGVYITTPINSQLEKKVGYHLELGNPIGTSASRQVVNSSLIYLHDDPKNYTTALVPTSEAQFTAVAQNYVEDTYFNETVQDNNGNKTSKNNNQGVTKVKSFIIAFTDNANKESLKNITESGYISPERKELYPKIMVGFLDSESSNLKQNEGGVGFNTVKNFKVNVKLKDNSITDFLPASGKSNLPPLFLQFNDLTSTIKREDPAPNSDTPDNYYKTYGGVLLIPIQAYTTTGTNVNVTPFAIYGNTKVNVNKSLNFSIQNSDKNTGDSKYVGISSSPGISSGGEYLLMDDDRYEVELVKKGTLSFSQEDATEKAVVNVSFPVQKPTDNVTYRIPIVIDPSSTVSFSDYGISNLSQGTVILNKANNYSADLVITAKQDKFIEIDELLKLKFGDNIPFGVIKSDTKKTAEITIKDTKNPVTLSLPNNNFVISEDAGEQTKEVILTSNETNQTGSDITIPVKYIGSSANISDFITSNSTFPASFVIEDGQKNAKLEFKANNDAEFEGEEKLKFTIDEVVLPNPLNRKLNRTEKSLIVLDNDTPNVSMGFVSSSSPSSTISSDATKSINEQASSPLILRVFLSKNNNIGHDITGKIRINGTATYNDDYTITGATSIASGQITVTIPNTKKFVDIQINPKSDAIFEKQETINFQIEDFSDNITAVSESAKQIKIDDDEKPIITIEKVQDGQESSSGTKQVKFLIKSSLVNNTRQPISFNLAYSGTSTKSQDFYGPTTIAIQSTESEATLNLDVVDDTNLELTETVNITLSPNDFPFDSSSVLTKTANITDDDKFKVNIIAEQGTEGAPSPQDMVIYNISIDKVNKTGGDLIIPLSFSGIPQSRFETTFPTQIIIHNNNNKTDAPISLRIKDDRIREGLQKLKLTAKDKDDSNTPIPFMLPGNYSRQANVFDDDVLNLTLIKESDGNEQGEVPIRFKIKLSQENTTGNDIDIYLQNHYISSKYNDFKALPEKVTIKKNDTEVEFSLQVVDDNILERQKEEIGVEILQTSLPSSDIQDNTPYIVDNTTFNNPVRYIKGGLEDNDTAIVSVISPTNVTEGSGADLKFKVSLNKKNDTGSDIVLNKSFINKTTTGWVNRDDFDPNTQFDDSTIIIPVGKDYANISMAVNDDDILENEEQVGLEVSVPSSGSEIYNRIQGDNGTKIASGQSKIIDNERLDFNVTSTYSSVGEGETVQIKFHLNYPNSGAPITFKPSYADSQIQQSDVDASNKLPTQIVFQTNQQDVTYDFKPIKDQKIEGDRNFKMSFLPIDNPILENKKEVSVLVKEGDDASLTIKSTPGKEGETPVVITVSLPTGTTNETGNDIQLFYNLKRGQNQAVSDDFTNISNNIIIKRGKNSGAISLEPIDDALLEKNEKVSIVISTSTNSIINKKIPNSGLESTPTELEENTSSSIKIVTKDLVTGGSSLILKYKLENKINKLGEDIVITPKYEGTYDQSDFLDPLPSTITIPDGSSFGQAIVRVKKYNDPKRPIKKLIVSTKNIVVGTNTNPSNIDANDEKLIKIEGFSGGLPEVEVGLIRVTDGSETPNKNLSFYVGLKNVEQARSSVFVNLSYSGTATAQDFVDQLPSQVEIPKGKKSVIVSLKVKEDFIYEEDKEILLVNISSIDTPRFVFDPDNNQIGLFVKDSKKTYSFEVYNNGISSNGDGINDVFRIKNLEKMFYNELYIVNRQGDTVFHQKNYDNSWGGLDYKGEKLPMGNYYYIFLYKREYQIQGRKIYMNERENGNIFIK